MKYEIGDIVTFTDQGKTYTGEVIDESFSDLTVKVETNGTSMNYFIDPEDIIRREVARKCKNCTYFRELKIFDKGLETIPKGSNVISGIKIKTIYDKYVSVKCCTALINGDETAPVYQTRGDDFCEKFCEKSKDKYENECGSCKHFTPTKKNGVDTHSGNCATAPTNEYNHRSKFGGTYVAKHSTYRTSSTNKCSRYERRKVNE